MTWKGKFPANSFALVWKSKQLGNVWHDSCVCSRSPVKSHENSPTIVIFVSIYCFSLYIRWLRWCLLQLHLPVLSFCRLEIITEAHVSLKTEGSSMGMPKPSSTLLLLLLIVTVSASQKQITSEARTLLSQKQSKYISLFTLKALSQWWFLIDRLIFLLLTVTMQFAEYSKIFSTLGVVCKCCDETGAECATTWTGSCHNLQCLPWKI